MEQTWQCNIKLPDITQQLNHTLLSIVNFLFNQTFTGSSHLTTFSNSYKSLTKVTKNNQ